MNGKATVVALTLAIAAAAGEPPSNGASVARERARQQFERGRTSFRAGRYLESLLAFEEGYRIDPAPLFLYGIAALAIVAGLAFVRVRRPDAPLAVAQPGASPKGTRSGTPAGPPPPQPR